MSDTRGSNPSRGTAPRRAEASPTAGASSSKLAQGQALAAAQYWQGMAAAGRAAKRAATQADTAKPARQRGIRV